MPRYTSKDGKQTIETSSAREGVNLRAQGFTQVPDEVFEPSTKNVGQVLDYLATAPDGERARVLAEEEAGKARSSILNAGGSQDAGDDDSGGDNGDVDAT